MDSLSVGRWSIAWVCSFVNFLLLGVSRLSGLLYLAAIGRYGVDRSRAALPFVLCYTVRNVTGPLIGYLGRKFEIRYLIAWGCFLSAVGAGTCFFAEDITTVTVLWGGVYGIGFGLSTILIPEVLNQHFDRYIAAANGIALGGECVAGFVLPVFFEFLLASYGTSGSFLILSGLILHGVPAALLLKSPSKRNDSTVTFVSSDEGCLEDEDIESFKRKAKPDKEVGSSVTDSLVRKRSAQKDYDTLKTSNCDILNRCNDCSYVCEEDKALSESVYCCDFNNCTVDQSRDDNPYIQTQISSLNHSNHCIHTQTIAHNPNNFNKLKTSKDPTSEKHCNAFKSIVPNTNNYVVYSNTNSTDFTTTSKDSIKQNSTYKISQDSASHKHNDNHNSSTKKSNTTTSKDSSNQVGYKISQNSALQNHNDNQNSSTRNSNPTTSKNSSNQNPNLNVNKTSQDSAPQKHNDNHNSSTKCSDGSSNSSSEDSFSISTANKTSCHSASQKHNDTRKSNPTTSSPFLVFLDPPFLLILLTQSSMIFIFTTIMTIIVDFSRDAGLLAHQEVYVLMCLSVSDMLGRFGLGWVTDGQHLSNVAFSVLCYAGTGLLMVGMVFLDGFWMVMVVAFFIGLMLGGLLIVCPGIILDYVERDKVTMALASRFVLYAPMSLTQSTLIGFFRENLGSYNGLFYILAVHCFFCCVCLLFVPFAARCRERRKIRNTL